MPQQNQAITALPNVLREQTLPNTLGGVSDPGRFVARRRAPAATSAVVAGALFAVLIAAVLAVAARIG